MSRGPHHYLPRRSLLRNDGRYSAKRRAELGWNRRLRPDFHCLEWAERNVGDQLGRSTGSQVQSRLVTVRIFNSNKVTVELLEVFVSSILERSLGLFTQLVPSAG